MTESPDSLNHSGLSNQACVIQVGLQPMIFDVKFVDGNICGLLTGVNEAPVLHDFEDDEEHSVDRADTVKGIGKAPRN